MTTDTWIPVQRELPARDQRVRWLSPSGDICEGSFVGVWLLDDGVYVYYEPAFWQPRD